ncbi:MAG: hypothetical protein GW893_02555 [Armatimonadetes bacterium]|nr:hypothetical protein [Armatimonadota bacterium]PIY42398.1 MAG: hypothetical protein COZ05_13970 [Armatimonadetes bacterium CG_4_10_14_3_um_filter_59_10]
MAHTMTLQVPDDIYQPLVNAAEVIDRQPEEVAVEWLSSVANDVNHDPLLALAGTLECELTDVADRHDDYIGQGLPKEANNLPMRPQSHSRWRWW